MSAQIQILILGYRGPEPIPDSQIPDPGIDQSHPQADPGSGIDRSVGSSRSKIKNEWNRRSNIRFSFPVFLFLIFN